MSERMSEILCLAGIIMLLASPMRDRVACIVGWVIGAVLLVIGAVGKAPW